MLSEAPIRLCCRKRHWGVICPDNKVMCCLCFERFAIDELAEDPESGHPRDVCLKCDEAEKHQHE